MQTRRRASNHQGIDIITQFITSIIIKKNSSFVSIGDIMKFTGSENLENPHHSTPPQRGLPTAKNSPRTDRRRGNRGSSCNPSSWRRNRQCHKSPGLRCGRSSGRCFPHKVIHLWGSLRGRVRSRCSGMLCIFGCHTEERERTLVS